MVQDERIIVGFVELFLIGVGLSMDAFAVAICKGLGMRWDAFHEDDEQGEEAQDAKLDLKELIMLAIATSIDALAVGITFAFLQVAIVPSVAIIGVVTFVLSFVGVAVGHFFGARFEKPATIVGGAVLILIGVKTLLEHLGVIAL